MLPYVQPYKKAPLPAGLRQSSLAAPNPLLLLCAEPPLRPKGYRQLSTSLNGENVTHCVSKTLGELVLLTYPFRVGSSLRNCNGMTLTGHQVPTQLLHHSPPQEGTGRKLNGKEVVEIKSIK